MPDALPFEWPPARFTEGFDLCEQYSLVKKLDEVGFLREIDQTVLGWETGKDTGRLNLRTYLIRLSGFLEPYVIGDSKFKKLASVRGDQALWDVTFAAYILMRKHGIIFEPFR